MQYSAHPLAGRAPFSEEMAPGDGRTIQMLTIEQTSLEVIESLGIGVNNSVTNRP
jgi:hypothetical protein